MKRMRRNSGRAGALATLVAAVCFVATALALSRSASATRSNQVTTTELPPLTKTIAGEPLAYPSTPNPTISSYVLTIPPGTVTPWMIHPVPAYLYVLEGTLTVEFVDGTHQEFGAGQAFLQCHTTWHRGRNDGTTPMRFLAVFIGAKDVPNIVHPPSGALAP